MTMDNFMEADILATCNALGSEIKGVYQKGTDCIHCLKDILLYLKRDSEDHGVLRYLGSIRLLQTDLLPILKRYDKNKEIFDFTLRILVALTNPALLLYKEDLPDDKISRNLYLQIISYLQSYKKAFVKEEVWKILYEHLKDLLKMSPLERNLEENLVVERIIILVRNILHVPPDESVLKQTDDDLSLHDKVLWSMHESNIDVLLLYMSVNEEEHEYCMHVLEIVSLMLREHTAEQLANSNETRTDVQKQKDLDILLAARQREQKLKLQKNQTVCRSRFNGVYCVKNVKSISDKDYIAHKLITNINDVKFDLQKNPRIRPKNRLRAPDIDNSRQSTLKIRIFLKKFCLEFLKTYNKMMVSVKRELVRKVSEEHDETYYMWAVCYFMQFNRMFDFQAALVSETISIQTFHHIQTEITNYEEMMLTDKKKQLFWARRMQLGVSVYKELLETLRKMEQSEDENIRSCADTLVSRVFYVIEYREMLLSLLSHYDDIKFPLSYLAELVESAQLFLKMLENHSKKHSEIIVQKKQRKVNRRKKKKPAVESEPVNEEDQLNAQWDTISSDLSYTLQGKRNMLIPNVTPFDGASEKTFQEQKIEAVFKIRCCVAANKPYEAVGLLRAARDLWPEGDSFGSADIEAEPEFMILREIHFSNLKNDNAENTPVEAEDVSDEEMESMPAVSEQQLNSDEIYKKYASSKVVMPCSLLLANYCKNKPQTNLCLIKLFHRIAWNCKMHALFFQSTIFLSFQKIFHDPDSKSDPIIKEFHRFATFIMQKFFSVAQKNNKIFVEFLFWKGSREAYEIEEGYGASEKKTKGWTDEDEEELKYLFEEYKDVHIEGQDVADIILVNFNKGSRTKNQIISALKRIGLIRSAKELKPEKRTEWVETEILELQHLFDDFSDSPDVMSEILGRLSIKRSRKAVVDKLLELNLIQDRKEVRKQGSRNKKSKSSNMDDDGTSDENDESFDNDNDKRNKNDSQSSDEDEINFFKNLEAERIVDKSSAQEVNSNKNSMDSLPVTNARVIKISNPAADKEKKKKLPPKIWEEQEVMELISLFNENQASENIMDIILNTLSVKRSKQAVVEKLLEMGLIKDKKEIQKKKEPKSKKENMFDKSKFNKFKNIDESGLSDIDSSSNDKPDEILKKKARRRVLSDDSSDVDGPLNNSLLPKSHETTKLIQNSSFSDFKKKRSAIWEENEVTELTTLFHANEGSSNIMQDVLNTLTTKRPKQAVIEKLLELGLIKDKKEVRKKKESKSKKNILKAMHNDDSDAGNSLGLSEKRFKKRTLSDSSDENTPLSSIFAKSNDITTPKSKEPSSLSAKKKRIPKVWEEQEIIELTSLFHKYQGSVDIVNVLSKTLTTKRPNPAIVEKLLDLGLIKHKKEVRKKRESKSKKTDTENSNLSNKDLRSSDDETAENDILSKVGKGKKKQKRQIVSESSDDDVSIGKFANMSVERDAPNSEFSSKHVLSVAHFSENNASNKVIKEKAKQNHKLLSDSSDEDVATGELARESNKPEEIVPKKKASSKSGKRKRLVISSDDSSDNSSKTNMVMLNEPEKESFGRNASKTKKKLCVLDDSNDSSSRGKRI